MTVNDTAGVESYSGGVYPAEGGNPWGMQPCLCQVGLFARNFTGGRALTININLLVRNATMKVIMITSAPGITTALSADGCR